MSLPQSGLGTMEISGNAVDVASDLKFSPAVIKQEILSGQSGAFQGLKVMPKNGYISAKLRLSGAFTARDFSQMRDVSVAIQMADGRTAQGDGLVQTEDIEVDTMENTIDVKFEGLVEEG